MKFLLSVLFVITLAAFTQSINSTWGTRNSTDILLLRENVVRTPLVNSYQAVTVDFPKSGQTNTRTITAVYVLDRFTNSSGATGSLWSGGPGYRFATVNLKSQTSRGINSTVEIYGK
ncbi:probable salivary secreted peptide [Teleopsis dalmanni]|uniref:probable salivary secreted peptide n=1 Tax=Teleopsis dalmanni TaxID=139649 RepID=UPI000D32D073|nr:probable salivary secreted peptide [Teleopsis dalmanni]XP_037950880.1 probable salivary secreted peptide [Teleopsis dalmanni]